MKDLSIRPALESDLAVIHDIYNYYVVHSTCTYQTEPSTLAERAQWFSEHPKPYCVTVAETGGEVAGWASLSRFHPRAGYAGTAENSVYVHPSRHRQGIGRALLADLIQRGKGAGFHTIIAIISADQVPSVKLHESFGFTPAGQLSQAGNKFNRWLDVAYLQLMLGECF
jgi:phosphinothricin acetyltransferase